MPIAGRRFGGGPLVLTVLVVVLIGLVILVQPRSRRDSPSFPSLSIHSSDETGARALFLWLADLGYRPAALERQAFSLDRQTRLLFVLAPTRNPTEAQVQEVIRWVEAGGTLALVADGPNRLLDRLGVTIRWRGVPMAEAVPLQPVLLQPLLTRIDADTTATLLLSRPSWVATLGAPDSDNVIAAESTIGRGRVVVLSAQRPFSNQGLGRSENWKLVLNLLSTIPAGSAVAFDEYHHGLTERGALESYLLREPWGWAILYVAVLLLAYVALAGRRFGRALPPAGAMARRSRGEYVATLGAMLRRGRHQEWLRRQYVQHVKRALGARYRVRPDLPAVEFGAALASRRPEAAALGNPLERLENGPAGEATIVALMREVEALRIRLERG